MTGLRYPLLVCALSATALWQALVSSGPGFTPGSYVDPPIGTVPAVVVSEAGKNQPLASISPGKCLFLVVYSESCPASRDAAQRWARDQSAQRESLPGWELMWVSVESERGFSTGMFPSNFLTRRGTYQSGPPLESALGISAYPATITLDENGVVTGGVVGAFYPQSSALSAECRYDPTELPKAESDASISAKLP